MSIIPTEVVVALIALIGASIPAYLLFRSGTKADANADENTAITANALIQTSYSDLVGRLERESGELRRKLEAADEARDQKLMGTVNLVQEKAGREEVAALEERLERAWKRIDADETRRRTEETRRRESEKDFKDRLEKAEAELEECKRARLAGNGGGAPA